MVVFEQRRVGDRLEPQLVAGVRGVRDELAQEDLLVAVERMDHQVEELLDLRLEPECFACRGGVHDVIVSRGTRDGGTEDQGAPQPQMPPCAVRPDVTERPRPPAACPP